MKIILLFIATLFVNPVFAAEQSVTLSVDNMTCALCPITVKKSLKDIEGVSTATVSLDDKTATIVYDDDKTNVSELIEATTFAGYPSRVNAK